LKISNPLIRKLTILAKFPDENPNPVIRVSKNCAVLYSNNAGAKLLESINSKRPGEKETFKVPEIMRSEIVKAIEKGESSKFDFFSDDRTYHFVVSPIKDINSAYLYGIDITERIELMNELRLNTAVFMNTTEGVMICDKYGDIQSINPAFVDITGFQADDVIGKNPRLLKSGRHDNKFYEAMWASIIKHGNWKGEIWNRRKDGIFYPQDTTINKITDNKGAIAWYASIFRDITKRKETENLLILLSSTDGLTGIANRRIFDEILEKEWKSALRSGAPISIAMIDIDHFKQYNDNYGHQQGDICLKKVALALQGCISRSTDLLARYGGEEFVVIMPMTTKKGAHEFAETMRAAIESMAMPHKYSKTSSHVTISIGIGVAQPVRGTLASEIVRLADDALYEAKNSGRNRVNIKSMTPETDEHKAATSKES
ncbi:MAG: diguanylate cyclase, partial [Desulfamplus sp.]|nr:diguanylate cyclase [Desulfamplus sp.]